MNFLVTCAWPRSTALSLPLYQGKAYAMEGLNDQTDHFRGRRRELAERQD